MMIRDGTPIFSLPANGKERKIGPGNKQTMGDKQKEVGDVRIDALGHEVKGG